MTKDLIKAVYSSTGFERKSKSEKKRELDSRVNAIIGDPILELLKKQGLAA